LAYSSISHIGYMLAGLGAAFTFGSLDGAQGGFFHLLTHGLMKGLAFLSAGALLYTLVIHKGEHRPLVRADLNGASKRFPLEALAFSIAVLALGGLPPLAGFMSKWQIFTAGITTHNAWMLALVIFMALNSVLSLGYYAPLVNALYRRKTSESTMQAPKTGVLLLIPVVLLTLAVVIVGFYPPVLTWLSNLAGSSMILSLGL
jgi:formate hydrogenlyase subunit 3/multisubunit Na+/H+ antiporter MnhD subunit